MNVKDSLFKASGNGIADDYPAIQAAIDAVGKAGGGPVDLPGGSYSISKALAWSYPDVYLRGDGAARIVPAPVFFGAAAIVLWLRAAARLVAVITGSLGAKVSTAL